MNTIKPSQNISLREKAYHALLQDLFEQRLVPGDLIDRRSVADRLNMSVAPVLEAMLQLETEGILEAVPRRGTRVRSITARNVWEHLIVREALECQAARLYCGKTLKDKESQLLSAAKDIDESERRNIDTWQKEVNLHRTLVGLAECNALTREFNRVSQSSLFLMVNMFLPPQALPKLARHATLIRKLKSPDLHRAETAIREHLAPMIDFYRSNA